MWLTVITGLLPRLPEGWDYSMHSVVSYGAPVGPVPAHRLSRVNSVFLGAGFRKEKQGSGLVTQDTVWQVVAVSGQHRG